MTMSEVRRGPHRPPRRHCRTHRPEIPFGMMKSDSPRQILLLTANVELDLLLAVTITATRLETTAARTASSATKRPRAQTYITSPCEPSSSRPPPPYLLSLFPGADKSSSEFSSLSDLHECLSTPCDPQPLSSCQAGRWVDSSCPVPYLAQCCGKEEAKLPMLPGGPGGVIASLFPDFGGSESFVRQSFRP